MGARMAMVGFYDADYFTNCVSLMADIEAVAVSIIQKYQWNIAWYARVELDDGSSVELKMMVKDEPEDDEFLALAEAYLIAIEPPPPEFVPIGFPIFTLDGIDLHKTTIKEFIVYLEEHPELEDKFVPEIIKSEAGK